MLIGSVPAPGCWTSPVEMVATRSPPRNSGPAWWGSIGTGPVWPKPQSGPCRRSFPSSGSSSISRATGPSWALLMQFWYSIILTEPACRAFSGWCPPAACSSWKRLWKRNSMRAGARRRSSICCAQASWPGSSPRSRWYMGARQSRPSIPIAGGRWQASSLETVRGKAPMHDSRPGRRVAVIAGVRTPFAKSGTVFRDASAVALARHAARELLYRSEVDGREIDEVVFSQVVPSVLTPNVAREVSLLPQLPPSVPAYTINRACASAAQAIDNAADQIALGNADVILAGGVESLSDIPVLHSRRFGQMLVDASKAKSLGARMAVLGRVRPR